MKPASTVAKKQYLRLSHIVSLLKQNKQTTVESLIRDLRAAELPDQCSLSCSRETVLRDIRVLKDKFGCDIRYSRAEQSYYMSNPSWTFDVPAVLDDSELMAIVLGCRFAQEVFPPSVSGPITQAVNEILRSNSADFMGTAMMDTLKILQNPLPQEDSGTFRAVIEAWSRRQILHIKYVDGKNETTERDIDPYYLVYHGDDWMIYSYCRLKKAEHTFMVARIVEARVLKDTFYMRDEIRQKLQERMRPENIYSFDDLIDAELVIGIRTKRKLEMRPLHSGQQISELDNGKFLLRLPGYSMKTLVPWIMRQCGGVTARAPRQLVDEVRKVAQNIISGLP